MFKQKCQRIDFNFLSNLNMMRIYEKYQAKDVNTDESRQSHRSEGGSFDQASQLSNSSENKIKNSRQYQTEMIQNIMMLIYEIVDSISSQIFEKVHIIPYSIRQFCKCLFEAAKSKFTPKGEEELF